MSDAFRTMILAAEDAPLARDVAVAIAPTGGSNMWTQGLSASGSEPATHYISTGLIWPQFAAVMPLQAYELDDDGEWVQTVNLPGQTALIIGACAQADPPLVVDPAALAAAMQRADCTEQEPFVAMARMGLKLINPPLDT